MAGSLVAALVANPAAFFSRSIYVNPLDGKNLNRVFPGDEAGGPSEKLAAWIYREIISPSDRFIDLHCGDANEVLKSFVAHNVPLDPATSEVVVGMAEAYGLDYILEFDGSGISNTTAVAAAYGAGIPSILAEVGGQGRFPDEDVALHKSGLRRALAAGGLLPVSDVPSRRALRMSRNTWMRSPATGCFLSAVRLGDQVEKGQILGVVEDFFGRPVAHVESPLSGVLFFLVTSLSTKVGDPLLGVAVE
jgi:predicted deacylase